MKMRPAMYVSPMRVPWTVTSFVIVGFGVSFNARPVNLGAYGAGANLNISAHVSAVAGIWKIVFFGTVTKWLFIIRVPPENTALTFCTVALCRNPVISNGD